MGQGLALKRDRGTGPDSSSSSLCSGLTVTMNVDKTSNRRGSCLLLFLSLFFVVFVLLDVLVLLDALDALVLLDVLVLFAPAVILVFLVVALLPLLRP